ncbi:MAG: hypothetical protein AAF799_31725 [Myxococcota bacterium]
MTRRTNRNIGGRAAAATVSMLLAAGLTVACGDDGASEDDGAGGESGATAADDGGNANGDGNGNANTDTMVDCGNSDPIDITPMPACLAWRDTIVACCNNPNADPLAAMAILCIQADRSPAVLEPICEDQDALYSADGFCAGLINAPICTGA